MSTPAADPAAFLSALSFDTDALRAMQTAVQAARDVRAAFEEEVRQDGGTGLRRAVSHYLLSQPEAALGALEDGEDTSAQAGLLRGLAALQVGDPATAVQALSALVGTPMEGHLFLTHLATAAALAGDADLAHKAASKLPDGADSLYAEGIALEAEGEYEEAQRKYEEAIAHEAQHARALFRLALRQDTAGDDAEAIETYRRCAAVAPANVNAILNMALLYEDRARYQEAEQCYRRILASDPRHVRARIGLKDVLASQNMYYDEDHERREDRRAQVLRTPITEFELSVRSRNCLAKMNIVTLGDLVRKTEGELLAYKNFGETSLQEIKDILAQKALRLGMTSDDEAPLYSAASHATAEAQLDALFGASAGGSAPAPVNLGASESRSKDPLEVPIEQLDLSIRARRCMDNLEIRTVGDLVRHSEAELLASKNFGQTSLNEVRRKLDALGLSLRRK